MIAHDPWRVRIRLDDGTYHCAVHGLLSDDDVRATMVRAGMNSEVVGSVLRSPAQRWSVVRALINAIEAVVLKWKARSLVCYPVVE